MEKRIGIGLSPITNRIYIGTIKKMKDGHEEWYEDKDDVTEEVVTIVAHHIYERIKREKMTYGIKIDGKPYLLVLKEDTDAKEDHL